LRPARKAATALTLAALCGVFQPLLAETVPPPGAVDRRVRVVSYHPDDVVKLQGYVGYQIHIQWAAGEELVNLGAGDVSGLEIGAQANHFFLKPKQERISTNLTVLTNRRAYHFDYTALKAPSKPLTEADLIYSIRFVYPQDDAERLAAAAERQRTEDRLTHAAQTAPRNADYWYCGAPALKPIAAHDDGTHTRLRFAKRGDFPALFVRNDDGSESLLNFSVEEDEVVIHRVARRLVLRRGKLVGCVVNHAFDGGGERPSTNTTVPGVARDTKGPTQ
jgi:type IV secretion system protein VirB9